MIRIKLLAAGLLLGPGAVGLQSPLLCPTNRFAERRKYDHLIRIPQRRRVDLLESVPALPSDRESSWLDRNPLIVKSLTMGVTYGLADLTAQAFGRIVCGDIVPFPARVRRTIALMLVGCLAVGPLLAIWFDFLEWLIPGRSPRAITSRTAIDQAFQVPIMISIIFTGTSLAEGHNLQYCLLKIQTKLLSTWRDCLGVWIPVQLINQGLVPLRFRVIFQAIISFFWDTYLSIVSHGTKL